MLEKIIMIAGGAAVGKTALLKHLLPVISQYKKACVCKIDCLCTQDAAVFEKMGIPWVVGLSEDICPDHFLVSNYMELIDWSNDVDARLLFIETAGLCNRCSPATQKSLQICVVDGTASCKSPEKLGPMLTQADIIAISKIDRISQAEKEILLRHIQQLNPKGKLFPFDGIGGYGIHHMAQYILSQPIIPSFEGDYLRHTMPSGVCSYCIGECRIGSKYQQGIVGKIQFGGQL